MFRKAISVFSKHFWLMTIVNRSMMPAFLSFSILLKTVDGAIPSIEPSSAMDFLPSFWSSRRIASSISSIVDWLNVFEY